VLKIRDLAACAKFAALGRLTLTSSLLKRRVMTVHLRNCVSLLTILIVCALPAYPQAQKSACTMKADQSPEVRGFKLGQTIEQLRAKFPKNFWLDTDDPEGTTIALLDRRDFGDNETYEGLEGVTLKFLDKKVASLTVKYLRDTKWNSQEEFNNVVTQNLKLPTTGWKGRYSLTLTCEDFTVETSAGASGIVGASIQISLRDLEQEMERRKLQKEADRRKVFKP
jgi:hypothetical protein